MGVIVHAEYNQQQPIFGSGYLLNPKHFLNKGLRLWCPGNHPGPYLHDLVTGSMLTPAGTVPTTVIGNKRAIGGFSTSNYYYATAGIPLAYPLSMACQFYPLSLTESDLLMFIGDTGTSNTHKLASLVIMGTIDDTVRAAVQDAASGFASANPGTACVTNKWQWGIGVWGSTAYRSINYDGIIGENTSSRDPLGSDTFSIGVQKTSGIMYDFSGYLANIQVWDRTLSLAEQRYLLQYPYGTPDNPRLLTLSGVTYFLPPSLYLRSLGISSAPTIALARQAAFYRALGVTRASTVSVSRIQQFKRILTATASSAVALVKRMFRILTATESSAAAIAYGRLFSRIMAATSSTVAGLVKSLVFARILAVTQASAIGYVRAISLTWTLTQGPSVSVTKHLYSSLSVLAASSVALCRGYFRFMATTAASAAVLTVHKTLVYFQSLAVTAGSAASIAKAKIKYVANRFFGIEVGRR